MSDTPRSKDAGKVVIPSGGGVRMVNPELGENPWVVPFTFAQELERENAALRHSEENLASTVRGLEFELEKAQKEVCALRADKRRLDWLNKTKLWKPDIRTVIDAARAKEGGAT